MPENPFDLYRYLPVSTRDRKWGLYLTGAGKQTIGPGITPDTHPPGYQYEWKTGRVFPDIFGALLFVEGERIEFESEATGSVDVAKGDLILLFPKVWHRYRADPNCRHTHFWFTFGGSQAHSWEQNKLISPRRSVLPTGMTDQILRPFQRLLEVLQADTAALQQVLAASAMEVIGSAAAVGRDNPEYSSAVHAAKRLMEQRVEQPVDLRELADAVHLTYERLRHAFTKAIGMAPYQYHLQLRVQRAQTLLARTDLTVTEIAARLNFTDSFHLSKVFKAKVGMSPTVWRSQSRREPASAARNSRGPSRRQGRP